MKKIKVIILIFASIILAGGSLSCFSKEGPFLREEPTLTKYTGNIPHVHFSTDPSTITEKDGWSVFTNGNDIRSLIVKENVIWAATSGGVVEWDLKGCTYRKYTTLDGLGDNNVRGITEDKDGYIWVMTDVGVSRFKGDSWKTFTKSDGLAGDYANDMIVDNEGIIWFTTDNGLSYFNGSEWTTFTEKDGLPNNWCKNIIQDNEGNYWVGTAGVSRYDGSTWQNFNQENGLLFDNVDSIFEDSRGNIWVRSYDTRTDVPGPVNGWSVFDGNKWTTITVDDGIIAGYADFIGEDSQGNIWFGSDRGMSRFDGKKWRNFTSKSGLIEDWVHSMVEDNQGNLWFACGFFDVGGISRFDGEKWESFTSDDGLPSNEVTFITKDKSGNIWAGTSNGISQYNGTQWRNYITDDGLHDNVIKVISQDATGAMWFSSWNSLFKYDGTSWSSFDSNYEVYHNQIYHDQDGNTWLFLREKVFKYDGTGWKSSDMALTEEAYPYFHKDNLGYIWWEGKSNITRFNGKELLTIPTEDNFRGQIHAILEDSRGDIWIGTSYGIWRFHEKTWSYYTKAQGLLDTLIYDMDQDKNGLVWASTSEGAVFFNGDRWNSTSAYIHGDIFTKDAIIRDNLGNLWFIALRNGVFRYDGTSWHHFTTDDGLIQNAISYAFADSKGNVWFVAENRSSIAGKVEPHYGVCQFDGENWKIFYTSDGLPRNIIEYMFEDQTGAIWFASLYGLARFIPN